MDAARLRFEADSARKRDDDEEAVAALDAEAEEMEDRYQVRGEQKGYVGGPPGRGEENMMHAR